VVGIDVDVVGIDSGMIDMIDMIDTVDMVAIVGIVGSAGTGNRSTSPDCAEG
jgi:hypothetical protein